MFKMAFRMHCIIFNDTSMIFNDTSMILLCKRLRVYTLHNSKKQ